MVPNAAQHSNRAATVVLVAVVVVVLEMVVVVMVVEVAVVVDAVVVVEVTVVDVEESSAQSIKDPSCMRSMALFK